MVEPDLFPALPDRVVRHGVATNPPPPSILGALQDQVRAELAALPPDGHGAIVGVATTTGVNFAVVSRVNPHLDVVAWMGKSWGEPIAGGAKVWVHW